METIIRMINCIKNRICFLDLTQSIKIMHRRMFIVSCLLLILFSFYAYNTLKSTKSTNYQQERIMRKNLIASKLAENVEEPYIYSKLKDLNKTRTHSENVIAYLVASYTGDPRVVFDPYPRLRERVLQLDERLDDSSTTDVIIFHTGYPFKGDMVQLIDRSRRHIEFVNIDHVFYKFSPGFDPHMKDPNWSQKGKWNYQHMCYFWFKQVFELKVVQRYRYMMRLDDDSQILGKWPNIFNIMAKHQAVYMANRREVDYEYVLPGLTLVRNLTAKYIVKNKIIARNPAMLADVFNHTVEVPNFWNNIEIVAVSFMQRDDVVDFIHVIDESKGVFMYRWGDAPLRYIILALFANASEVLHRGKLDLAYCHPC